VAGGTRAGVGILGGTFNPPHLGHLAAAQHARERLGLERVVLMPANTSPGKQGELDPGPEHRLQMCRLAVTGQDGVGVCALEIERGGTSYTVDTLRAIHASHPNAELTLIVGADTASTLPTWREPQTLLELADIAVVARSGSAEREVRERLRALLERSQRRSEQRAGGESGTDTAAQRGRIRFLQMLTVDVSSSLARETAAGDGPLAELVGPAVAGYIREHGLYGAPRGSA